MDANKKCTMSVHDLLRAICFYNYATSVFLVWGRTMFTIRTINRSIYSSCWGRRMDSTFTITLTLYVSYLSQTNSCVRISRRRTFPVWTNRVLLSVVHDVCSDVGVCLPGLRPVHPKTDVSVIASVQTQQGGVLQSSETDGWKFVWGSACLYFWWNGAI